MSNDRFFSAVSRLQSASGYEQVFTVADAAAIRSTYRQLIKAVHPDLVEKAYGDIAADMSEKLARFYKDALEALQAGAFGHPVKKMTLTSATATHTIVASPSPFCDMTLGLRAHTTSRDGTRDTFVKVARTPRDNELLETEATILGRLRQEVGSEHAMYYPELVDSFMVVDGRKRLRANAVAWQDGFYNLEEILKLQPDGVHPLDMGWVWRRLLWALGGAHDLGVLHGAVLPRHVLIHPTLHGVVLADWCYAVTKGTASYRPLRAVVGDMRDWYPAEVFKKEPPTPRLDLVMAARTMQCLMGMNPPCGTWTSQVPMEMQRYFTHILSSSGHQSAYELLAEFDRLLERLGRPYFPRTYRPLKV